MAKPSVQPTGRESFFDTEEIIVTKTDLKGKITYANEVFLRVSKLSEHDAIGAPHSLIRHPDMPRAVFKLLWDRIQSGKELFAYVMNMATDGDHYWVFAHVTPIRNAKGEIVGYHSTRRVPNPDVVRSVSAPLYGTLAEIERRNGNPKVGMAESGAALTSILTEKALTYDELIFSLQR